jgi:peptide/nickel transport system permease protein
VSVADVDAKPERAASAWRDTELFHDFRRSPLAVVSLLIVVTLVAAALGADVVAPFNSNDPASANVIDARLPPGSIGTMGQRYLLGTDPQGRDMLSAIIYGLRISLLVGFGSVALAAFVGMVLGLLSGYCGGLLDALVMRIADVQLSFPTILIALMIDGITRTVMGREMHDAMALSVLILAIAATYWVQYARIIRGLVLVERTKEYVLAAKVTGVSPFRIIASHIRPNVTGPMLVIATINLALAIITEATLSFLGVGVPPTMPSLGMLVRIGNEYLFSGDWWISIFPGATLVLLSLSVNLFGDWLRDALNPKLSGT